MPMVFLSRGVRLSSAVVAQSGDADADWENMTASASMSTRFDDEADYSDYILHDDAFAADGSRYDTSVAFHGSGSLALDYKPGTDANTNPGNWFRFLSDSFGLGAEQAGTPTDVGYDPPRTFEVAYCLRMQGHLRANIGKTSIVSCDGSSNQTFEVVWQNTGPWGIITGYHRNPANSTNWWDEPGKGGFTSGCSFSTPDFNRQPDIDDNSAWSDCEKAWGRYGFLRSYIEAGTPDAVPGTTLWKFYDQLDPLGEFIGPIKWPVDEWFWLKVRIVLNSYSAATNDIDWYIQRKSDVDWVLLNSTVDCTLPTSSAGSFNIRYNAVWLTVRRDDTTPHGTVHYGGVICRDDGGSIPAAQFWPNRDDTLYAKFDSMDKEAFDTLATPSMTGDLVNNGGNDNIMSWARRGQMDFYDNKAYFYGCTHVSGQGSNSNYVIHYDTTNHTWVKEAINDPEAFSAGGIHGYYHFTLRPIDGHQFLRQRGSANIYDRARGGAWGSTLVPDLPGTQFVDWNIADALEWYPDFGIDGALVFSSQTKVYTWEPGDVAWTQRGTLGATADNDSWSLYNQANRRMYFGGGQDTNVMYRMDPDGVVTQVAATPFRCGASPGASQDHSPVISAGLVGGFMFCINPTTGAIHEYNHLTNAWSDTGEVMPFVADLDGSHCYFHVTVPGKGVFFHYIDGNPNPSSTMHLWKR